MLGPLLFRHGPPNREDRRYRGGVARTRRRSHGLLSEHDESLSPGAEAVADPPTVTGFSFDAKSDGCAFDPHRGGLVHQGLTIKSKSTGVLQLSFYVQRDSLDDILPGYVSTVLTFGDDSRSHTFDLVVPVTREDYEAGYDECRWNFGGR